MRDIPVEEVAERLDPMLLYSIYAVASCIVPPDRSKADSPQQAQEDRGAIFFERAERYVYAGRLRPDVSTIQSLFLLSLYAHGNGELSQAWVWCNLASAMAFDLGLHRWPIHRCDLLWDSNERETRVRLIWHLYILDKMLAAEMGRPVTTRANDIDAPYLSEAEIDEVELYEADVEDGDGKVQGAAEGKRRMMHVASCLNWTIKLFKIVEKILSEFHSFRRKAALRKQGDILDSVAQLDAELAQWHADLPDHLRLDQSFKTVEGAPLPAFFALTAWYQTSILLLHRNFIPQDEGAALAEVLANDSHKKCTAAAHAICDMLETTSQFVRVDRLSTDLAYCFFTAAVMFVFNARLPDEAIAADAKRRFMLCRESLRKLSETWPSASAHKQLLDGFTAVGEGVLSDDTSATVLDLPPPRLIARTSTSSPEEEISQAKSMISSRDFTRISNPSRKQTSWEESNERSGASKKDRDAEDKPRGRSKTRRAVTSRAEKSERSTGSSGQQSGSKSNASASLEGRRASVTLTNSSSLYRPENWTAEQRAQMEQLYASAGSGGQRPNASAHTFNPTLWDLESVFYNEWKAVPANFALQQPQQQQPFGGAAFQAMQASRGSNGAGGLELLANATGAGNGQPQVQIGDDSNAANFAPMSSPSIYAEDNMVSQPTPAQLAALQQFQYRQQQIQQGGDQQQQQQQQDQQMPASMAPFFLPQQQQQQQQSSQQQEVQGNTNFLQIPNAGNGMQMPSQLQAAQQGLAAFGGAMSPFSFSTDPNPNAILELLAMLELPPSFAS